MAQRREPPDSLDFFPTPPWATRALVECVLHQHEECVAGKIVWEPAAGEGHMAVALWEYGPRHVHESDVHDYGRDYRVGSFVGEGPDVIGDLSPVDWIITNPPFNLAAEFAERALNAASGVALLVRTAWLEGGGRFHRLFQPRPPSIVAVFCERVPMVKGRWDPKASTATSYCWVVWMPDRLSPPPTQLMWIPPGQRERLSKPDDVARFAISLEKP